MVKASRSATRGRSKGLCGRGSQPPVYITRRFLQDIFGEIEAPLNCYFVSGCVAGKWDESICDRCQSLQILA